MKTNNREPVKSASLESHSISAIESSSTPMAPLEILVLPALGHRPSDWIESIEGAPAALEAMQDLECSQLLVLFPPYFFPLNIK
jgi:hypothetical protein